jgi:pimeloyl-ACP methyl ester carboxylesterase
VVLLHGWPYDIHSFVDAAPLLSSAGFRVLIPYLRGYGTTRCLSGETRRNGQQVAVALDVVALLGDYPLHIIVKRGTITLLGVLDSEADKTVAGLRAREVAGSFGVENDLVVENMPVR